MSSESDSAFSFRPEAWPRLSALLDESFDMDEAARAALIERTRAEDAALGAELAALLDSPNALSSLPTAPRVPSKGSSGSAGGVAFTSLLNQVLLESAGVDSAGQRFGPWTLVARIGQGGMGEVWRAVRSDGLFAGSAAIKLLRSDLPAERLAARFARERTVLARLNHPNIARLLDAGVAHEQAYIVLELVDGTSLLAYAEAHAQTLAERVRLIRDVARAVEHAHSQLVLHRDLKPSNVLVTHDGTVKLLDFGIAAALDEAISADTASNLTQLTGRGLTVEYAAPEQILGQATVAASDVYSLGVMLFHLVTGQRPFAGESNRVAQEFAAVHTDAPRASDSIRARANAVRAEPGSVRTELVEAAHADNMTPPTDTKSLRGDLDAIIGKALRKSPTERYATATAFAADLDAWLMQTPISIRAEDRGYRWRLWFRRNWKVAGFAGIAAMAIVVGLGVSLWQRSEAVSAAQREAQEKQLAIDQRHLAEAATARAEAALTESEKAKGVAEHAQQRADASTAAARQSEQLAVKNERLARQSETIAASATRTAQSEAAKAKAVNQYLVTLFEGADPEHVKGDKLTAREVLDAGAKTMAAQFTNDPQSLAELQAVLGKTYLALSQPQTAAPLLADAAAAAAKRYGIRSIERARILHSLARAELDIEKYPESGKHYEEALRAIEPVEGPVGNSVVNGKVDMAYAYQKQGRYAEVDGMLNKLRDIVVQQLGETHWLFAEVENGRSVSAAAQRRLQEAQDILLRIEPLLKSPPVGSRSQALLIRTNLAISRGQTGQLADGIARLDQVIFELQDHLGSEADLALKARWFAGEFSRLDGRYAQCAENYAKLAEVRARVSGETHPLTVDIFSKTALCAQLAGNEQQSAVFAKRALAGVPASDEPPQRTVLRTLLQLQMVALDRADDAVEMTTVERARALMRTLKIPAAAPETAWLVAVDACAAAKAGDVAAALRIVDAVVEGATYQNLMPMRALHAYLLMLNDQRGLAAAEMIEVKKLATARYPNADHPMYRTIDYLDALVGDKGAAAQANQTLVANAGRTVRAPLAPIWFGF